MHIILNHSSMVPIYEQLMEQIKSKIIENQLVEGAALPSVRALSGELRISARRKTVEDDFEKVIDRALAMGMNREEIREVVNILLEEK